MIVQQPPCCWGAYGSSRLSTWAALEKEILFGVRVAYLSPYRRYHEVTSIVAVIDQPGKSNAISDCDKDQLLAGAMLDLRHGSL